MIKKIDKILTFFRMTGRFARMAVFLSIPFLYSSCNFENVLEPTYNDPVKEYFKEYTESAAIMVHEVPEESYKDKDSHLCIDSIQDYKITFYMRNPQRYRLITTTDFYALDESIDTSITDIIQDEDDSIILTLPLSFLAACDEGKEISPTVHITEPKSGRNFPDYTFSLYCNSKPPKIFNSTVLNDSNQTFVLAFDMPSSTELKLRHKDLTSISVNDEEFPISVDSEGNFSFTDTSRFSRTYKSSYLAINNKSFAHSDRSVYFATNKPFTTEDTSYTITLKDKAGLTTVTQASTKITRLEAPSVITARNKIPENGSTITSPFLPGKKYTEITLISPSKDHEGNSVKGSTVHYNLYNKTEGALVLIESSSFEDTEGGTSKTFQFELGKWHLEAYAELTNYETSPQYTCTVRSLDADIYVTEKAGNDTSGDGGDDRPFASIERAFEEISERNDDTAEYRINLSDDYSKDITIEDFTGTGMIISGTGSNSVKNITIKTEKPVTLEKLTITGSVTQSDNNTLSLEELKISKSLTSGTKSKVSIGKNVVIEEKLTVKADTNVTMDDGAKAGNVTVAGTLTMTGSSSIAENADISGTVTMESTSSIKGNCSVQGTLTMKESAAVKGNTTVSGTVQMEGGVVIKGISTVKDTGVIEITGDLTQTSVTTITPQTYSTSTRVLKDNSFTQANYTRFVLTPNEATPETIWAITSKGLLEETKVISVGTITIYELETDINVKVSKNGNTVTLTSDTGYTNLIWEVDETNISVSKPYSGITASANTLTLDMTNWQKGRYDVVLTAEKDGNIYSYRVQIEK